ncbi:MAG: histidine kinase, partial [Aliarcobacter sp.]|nr:histidine kinase [Aliarcobacter sp.]
DELIKKSSNEEKYIFIDVYKDSENEIYIVIKDNAGGINKEFIDKVFEPYFTTKHKSQGTGIGLYMTEEIISKHLNGRIFVKNKEFTYKDKDYVGAQFTIVLSLIDDD